MPSNKDLKNSISAAAETLNIDVPDTEGATNADMADTLKEMNAEIDAMNAEKERLEREELEAAAEEDSAAAALLAKKQAEEAAAEEDELPEFYISKGKAITSRRGILADGDEITVKDLIGGEKAIKAFIKSGHISKG